MVNHKCLWHELKVHAATILLGVAFSLFSCAPAALAAGGILSVFSGNSGTIADGSADDLGNVAIAHHSILYTVRNQGTDGLTVQTILSVNKVNVSSFSYQWRDHNDNVVSAASFVIPAGQSGRLEVTEQPATAGPFAGGFGFNHDGDGADGTFNIILKGNDSGTPEISVIGMGIGITDGDATPSASDGTDFGSVVVSSGTMSRSFNIDNLGNGLLSLGGASLSGANASDFSITAQPATVIAASGSASLRVQFSPSAPGTRTAVLTIPNDDADEGPFTFTIAGTGVAPGPEIAISGNGTDITDGDTTPSTTDSTDFGSAIVGSTTVDKTYTITNSGTSVLNLTGISIVGDQSSDFSIVYPTPATPIAANGGTSTLTIRFTPSAAGTRAAMLSIYSDDPDENPFDFAIVGTATAAAAPEISVSGNSTGITDGDTTPNSADGTDFGAADVTTGAVSRTFTITNSGTNVLTLGANAVSLSGTNAADFAITSQPATTVAASGGTTTLTVLFDPSASGTRTATLSIANDDADESPFDFAIQGTGTVAGTGNITIALDISGADTSLGFTSPTSALNVTLATSSGHAETRVTGLAVGTHTLTAADLSASGYAITAIACDDTDSTADVSGRVATIVLASSETVTCTFSLREVDEVTSQMIVDFLGTRNSFILDNQPDLSRRIAKVSGNAGSDGGTASLDTPLGFAASVPAPVSVSLSGNRLSYAGSADEAVDFLGAGPDSGSMPDIGKWDIWSEGSFSLFDTSGSAQKGHFGIVHLGADTMITEDILVGTKVQFDWMDQDFAATSGTVSGFGAMAGPYATIALGENFFFDVSGLWGISQNAISPVGTYSDQFTTTRWLVDASLSGQFEQENWTLQPTLALKYINEDQQAYTNALGVPIPAQTVAQGEISFAPRVSYDYTLENGTTLTPWLQTTGLYAFQAEGTPSTASYAYAIDGLSASVGAGLDISLPGGAAMSLSGKYGGIGTSAKSYGVKLRVSAALD